MTAVTGAVAETAPSPAAEARAVPRPSRPAGRRRWQRLISPVALVVGWEAAARSGLLPPDKLPAPSEVLRAGARLAGDGTLFAHLLDSLERAVIGLAVGGALALVAGAAAGLLRIGDDLVDPPVQSRSGHWTRSPG